MTSIETLIARLSTEAKPARPLRTPAYWSIRLLAVLVVYGLATPLLLGLRPDLAVQLTRPLYVLEVAMLALLAASSVMASILAMYPDAYQKPSLIKLPYGMFLVLAAFVAAQSLMPHDERMAIAEQVTHGLECVLCIALVAIVPSALIFAVLRKGASIRPFQAGALAVLSASAIGGLTTRLVEANDSIAHLVAWHYVPTVLFAAIGALIGRCLLRW